MIKIPRDDSITERRKRGRLLPNPLHDDDDESTEDDHGTIKHLNRLAPAHASVKLAREYIFIPYLPFLRIVRNYRKKDLMKDLLAGIVVSVVAVPQGLAYSILAGLPAVMGLYTSAIPPLIYGFLGTSKQLSVGPVAIVSMFIPAIAIQVHMAGDPVLRVAVAALSCIISGLLLVLVGVCRLAGLVKFISSPVLTGFTTAAAVVIGVVQAQHILGFFLPESQYNYDTVHYFLSHLNMTNPYAVLVGLCSIIFLFASRVVMQAYQHNSKVKAFTTLSTLLCVMLATVAAYHLTRAGYDLPIVGPVPKGLPAFAVPRAAVQSLDQVGNMIVACMPVTCLAFMSSWSLSRKFASKFNQTDLDPNQEAVAIGVSNIVAGFFTSFPSSGSFGRTSLNAQNGARTPISNLYAAVAVLLCLLFFTPYLYYVPMACLGAIIEVSLLSLFELKPFKKAYRVSKPDFIVMTVTFVCTLAINIEIGLIVGIFASIAVLLQELSEIHTSVLIPVCGHGRFLVRSQSVDTQAVETKTSVQVIRLTASIFFGNHTEVREAFETIIRNGGDGLYAIVVDASGVSHLDLSGIEAIEAMYRVASQRHVKVVFAHAKGLFRERLHSSRLWNKLGCDEYGKMSVDEIVTKLLAEQGITTQSPEPDYAGGSSTNGVSKGGSGRRTDNVLGESTDDEHTQLLREVDQIGTYGSEVGTPIQNGSGSGSEDVV